MADERDAAPLTAVAALEHQTGPSRGTVTWLGASTSDITLSRERLIRVSEARPGEPRDDLVARLHRAEDTYEIEAPEGRPVWVNRVRVTARRLEHCDIIEFGETGPLSRFRLYRQDKPARKTVGDILGDCIDYLRVSRQPLARRVFRAYCVLLRRLTLESTILFRTTVVVAILALTALAYQQARLSTRLQQRNRDRRCPARQLRRSVGPRQRSGAHAERPRGAASGTRAPAVVGCGTSGGAGAALGGQRAGDRRSDVLGGVSPGRLWVPRTFEWPDAASGRR